MPNRLQQQIRIISGIWKSRIIRFPALAEVRPTPDRVRETLFNWLAPVVQGAYCLDLFAGSGALSFEALSRGAEHVIMVDKSPLMIEHLRATCQQLNAPNVTIYQAKAPESVIVPPKPFDIVFLDPPFHHDLIPLSIDWLQAQKLVISGSYVYLEMEIEKKNLLLPEGWQILKQGKTRQVAYYLVRVED